MRVPYGLSRLMGDFQESLPLEWEKIGGVMRASEESFSWFVQEQMDIRTF